MTRVTVLSAVLVSLLAPAWAGGGDYQANRLYKKAVDRWSDPDPQPTLQLLEQALAVEDVSEGLKIRIQLAKGRLLVAQLGDPVAAEVEFDEILRRVSTRRNLKRWHELRRKVRRAETDPRLKERLGSIKASLSDVQNALQIKGQAMVAKANVCYAERGEVLRAMRIYVGANYAWQSATTCDVASQFCYRVSQSDDQPPEVRAQLLGRALTFCLSSLQLAPQESADEEAWKRSVSRYMLQLALVQLARGARPAARVLSGLLDPKLLGPETLYQQAMLAAAERRDDDATRHLRRFFDETKPTAAARNDLRKFVRTEPDFQRLLRRGDWTAFVEDEPLGQ